jgi:uncharacterized protein YaiI (UPF0178 family)
MKVLIDADGCPVVEEVLTACRAKNIEVIILCDTSHQIEREGVKTITVSKGADSVDFTLVNLVKPGDVAITQDYGLAAMCLAKQARVLRQDGLEYTNENMDALLTVRYEYKKVRMAGGRVKGPSKRKPSDDINFLRSLNNII